MTDEEHLEAHQIAERRSEGNRKRVLELVEEVNNISTRVHALEDHFELDGMVYELQLTLAKLALDIEVLRNGWQRSRQLNQEHSPNRGNPQSTDSGTATTR